MSAAKLLIKSKEIPSYRKSYPLKSPPSRLTEIGANKFHEAAEAIRMSKPLGCLLDSVVRVAKGIWKSCKHLESKRPPLKKLAIIYVQCAEYIERIEKENLLTSLALDLEDLRRIATEYDLDKQGSLILSELLEATQNTNDQQAVRYFVVCFQK